MLAKAAVRIILEPIPNIVPSSPAASPAGVILPYLVAGDAA
jgi:hypothetical protein